VAADIDPEATSCSGENLERNGITSVTLITGTLEQAHGGFDLILANIQADVLLQLAAPLAENLVLGGHAILSGILLEQVDEVIATYERAGLVLGARRDEDEWSALLLAKASP
jgi:ribosomal protein L11 methyltransferase